MIHEQMKQVSKGDSKDRKDRIRVLGFLNIFNFEFLILQVESV